MSNSTVINKTVLSQTEQSVNSLLVNLVNFNYGERQALSDVSFTVGSAESVVLLGPNGAGKSTLFSIICGLFAADSGDIEISGRNVQVSGVQALAPLGIVFQAQTLDLDLTVQQNLRYFCALHGMSPHTASLRIDEALRHLDLFDRKNDKVRSLNGGHRRRVEIARATLHRPSLLLLDEPTVGLDIPTRRGLIEYLHSLSAQEGVSLLWATHLIDEVYPTDRVIVLRAGKIVANDLPAVLMENSQTESLEAAYHFYTEPRGYSERAE